MSAQTAYGILTLITFLLGFAHFNNHPLDGEAVKRILSQFKRYLVNEDSEHLVAYGIMLWALVVLVVCLLNWEWF